MKRARFASTIAITCDMRPMNAIGNSGNIASASVANINGASGLAVMSITTMASTLDGTTDGTIRITTPHCTSRQHTGILRIRYTHTGRVTITGPRMRNQQLRANKQIGLAHRLSPELLVS